MEYYDIVALFIKERRRKQYFYNWSNDTWLET